MIERLKYGFVLCLLLLTKSGVAQTYGNEWINYNQSYYTFKIATTGIYRIDYTTLNAAGVPLGSFQSENIQLFGKEREIPVHIVDGGDNSIDAGDYLIFYAERNDGWLDSTVYLDPNSIGNPEYSLYNDTLIYFFTWNSSAGNLRYTLETDTDFSSYPSIEDYVLFSVSGNANSTYQEGEKINGAASSFFVPGEGWGSTKFNGATAGHISTFTLNTPFPFLGGPDAKFHGLSSSASNAEYTGAGNHHVRWEVGPSFTNIYDTIFIGYKQIRCNKDISTGLLSDGNTTVRWRILNDVGALTDYQAYSYYAIEYPRIPNFGGLNALNFKVKNNAQGKIRLDLTNVGYNIPIMLVHGDQPRMVPLVPNGGVYSVLIPNSTNGSDQKVIFRDSSLILNVSTLTPVNGTGIFNDYTDPVHYTAGNTDNALIFITHPALESASNEYVTYRSNAAGGGYNVLKANVNELYLQFGGGIEKHVNGVRRFAHLIYNSNVAKPAGLFLVGKGIREASTNDTGWDGAGTRKNVARFHASFIPSFGQPSSDICITARLEGASYWTPLMPTGRISARTNQELLDYLEKVQEFDLQQDQNSVYNSATKDWQKHIMHFAGGSTASQQGQFQGYMNFYESIIEDSLFGGEVHQVYKTSSDPLDPTILAGITERIEEGVSLMSYFGHSTASNSGFEINLDEPQNWNNTGKYPVMLVNSCYNGNIYQAAVSKSEVFVQMPDFGAIAYIASAGVGLDVFLNQYSIRLYLEMARQSYGKTIAEQMKNTVGIIESGGGGLYAETTCTQMVLNGDPMLKLNWHDKPEIELTVENVTFLPTDLDLTVDSIEMHILLKNLGKSITDTFSLEVIRNFPGSNIDSVYLFVIPKLDYTHDFSFKMPLQANISAGINYFTIKADIPSQITEQYDEVNNNQIIRQFHINLAGIVPVIPYDFAVVPIDSVTVKASTIDPVAPFNTYRFELDTTDLFDSPQHRYAYVSGLGGVKEVNPSQWLSVSSGLPMPLVCEDSMVYFWRVAVDSSVLDWREHSFQYIIDKEGWGQDHFFQFKKNTFNNLDYDRPTRTKLFAPNIVELTCDVLSSTGGLDPYYNAYYIGGELMSYGIWTNFTPKLHVAVIDPLTFTPWKTGEYNFGANNNAEPNWKFFAFHQNDPVKLANFQNMVLNGVPDGHYILIYSPITTRYDWWNALDSANMYNTFTALGSDSINASRPNRPFAFFCKKGDPSTVVEEYVQVAGGQTHLEADMIGSDYLGNESSTMIGPAATWKSVFWKQDPMEAPFDDTTVLYIRAFDITGVMQLEIDTAFTLNDSIIDLAPLIDAAQYPFLQLSAYYLDSVSFTPAQLDYWHVLYEPLPEAAIDGSSGYSWIASSDTLSEGQQFDFAVDIKNIFSIDMDSLLVSYWIEDANQIKHPVAYPRQDSLLVGETLRDTVTINTTGLGGWNSLWVEVNPYVNGSLFVTDQPEQAHFNNMLQIPFYVNPDERNPILDVTFDGRHILNGDIIDPNSEVLITLKDDNEFLIMNEVADTALFGVYLTDPAGNMTKIPFMNAQGETIMQWIPADAQHKRFKIIWPASFTKDGEYILTVQGSDKSGNLSGDIEYRVTFEVIHASTITNMLNYPNPFSTSTHFVFTLTGSEVPDDILIQIMTVTGRVVREITEDQIGPIHIGRNITDFAWDGKDEFGDPLANGVYLYRVKAKINGEDIEHRESGADQYFKKNFGKMYLMR